MNMYWWTRDEIGLKRKNGKIGTTLELNCSRDEPQKGSQERG
jgi:hypothetical protein